MDTEKANQDLANIREMMEKSTRFISLSGWTGVLAGIYALAGSAVAYNMIYQAPYHLYDNLQPGEFPNGLIYLVITGLFILLLAIVTGIILTGKKAKKQGQSIWNSLSQRLFINLAIPLVTGGIIVIYCLLNGYYSLIPMLFLVFYGLGLINASHVTLRDVRSLGISELILGLIALFLPAYGLLFFALGFGVLHIAYGLTMYMKYDR